MTKVYKLNEIPTFESWEYVTTKQSKQTNIVKVTLQKDLSKGARFGLFFGALGASAAALLLLPLISSGYRSAVKNLWNSVFSGKAIKKITVKGTQEAVDMLMRPRLNPPLANQTSQGTKTTAVPAQEDRLPSTPNTAAQPHTEKPNLFAINVDIKDHAYPDLAMKIKDGKVECLVSGKVDESANQAVRAKLEQGPKHGEESIFHQELFRTLLHHVANRVVSLSDPSCKSTSLHSVHFRGQATPLESIKVLDQTKANEPFVFCGCHALKNATVALGVAKGYFPKEAFEDAKVYQAIKAPIQDKSGPEGDASIAPLAEFWRELSDPSLAAHYNASESLTAAHQTAKSAKSSLTMLTYEGEVLEEDGQLILDEVVETGNILGDETTLPHIASLVELSKKFESKQPFHHAFVMGSQGHWVTVVVEKSPDNSIKWYGLDSWHNDQSRFPAHILVIDKILAQPQEFAKKAYHNLIGQDLQRKRAWFTDQGAVKDPNDQTRLLQPENQNKYLSRIAYASEFFKQAGWTDQSHPDEFAAVRALATFYNANGADQDPRVQKALQVV